MNFTVTPASGTGRSFAGTTIYYEIEVRYASRSKSVKTSGIIHVAADHDYGDWDCNRDTGVATRTCSICGHAEEGHFPTDLRVKARADHQDASDIALVHGDAAELEVDVLPDAPAAIPYSYGDADVAFSWWVDDVDFSQAHLADDLVVNMAGNGLWFMDGQGTFDEEANNGEGYCCTVSDIPLTSGAMDFTIAPSAALAGKTVRYEILVGYDTGGLEGNLRVYGAITVTHDYEEEVVVSPTCEEDGSATYICRVVGCGDSHTGVIPALGHDWGDWEVTAPATADAEGVETRVCARDHSHKQTRVLAKLAGGKDKGGGVHEHASGSGSGAAGANASGGTSSGSSTGGTTSGSSADGTSGTTAYYTATSGTARGAASGDLDSRGKPGNDAVGDSAGGAAITGGNDIEAELIGGPADQGTGSADSAASASHGSAGTLAAIAVAAAAGLILLLIFWKRRKDGKEAGRETAA
ncbi:MAG: hypothetical protein LBR44_09925 [Clostridiales Family XIII bacterium]|nr:hypothetical protein [Clostridiales Family XIII bacterium]